MATPGCVSLYRLLGKENPSANRKECIHETFFPFSSFFLFPFFLGGGGMGVGVGGEEGVLN